MLNAIRVAVLALTSSFFLAGCLGTGNDNPARSASSQASDSASSSSSSAADAGSAGTASAGANAAPKMSGTPAGEIPAGFPYVFRPVVTDTDGDKLQFEIIARPSWASFEPSTGELRGVPTDGDVGLAQGIMIIASDGRGGLATVGPFQIRVNRSSSVAGVSSVGVRPPTVSGTPPPTVVAGTGYSFQVVASDPDGDRLTFGALNLPPWLGINSSNGTLTGTPTTQQVGTYTKIVISVTDGRNTVSLPAFSIEVTPSAAAPAPAPTTPITTNGKATLRWVPPTANADGTALNDLAGFYVRYSRDPNDLSQVAQVANPVATTFTVEGLSSGKWYFAVASYTSTGIKSDISSVVSKTFP